MNLELIHVGVRDISGEFGIVYRGHLLKDGGKTVSEMVAIKTLKGTLYLAQFYHIR